MARAMQGRPRFGLPSLHTVNSNIDPPNSGDTEDTPQVGFAQKAACGRPLNEEQPHCPGENEKWYAKREQKLPSNYSQ